MTPINRVDLPLAAFYPHQLKNEDGILYYHEGYMVKLCKNCGTEYILGKNSPVKTEDCGRAVCERKG